MKDLCSRHPMYHSLMHHQQGRKSGMDRWKGCCFWNCPMRILIPPFEGSTVKSTSSGALFRLASQRPSWQVASGCVGRFGESKAHLSTHVFGVSSAKFGTYWNYPWGIDRAKQSARKSGRTLCMGSGIHFPLPFLDSRVSFNRG